MRPTDPEEIWIEYRAGRWGTLPDEAIPNLSAQKQAFISGVTLGWSLGWDKGYEKGREVGLSEASIS